MSHKATDLPNIAPEHFRIPVQENFSEMPKASHAPRFLLLYGSLREKSYSRLLTMEAARLLEAMGGEVKIFDPQGLPLPCLLYTSPSPRDLSTSRMPSSA